MAKLTRIAQIDPETHPLFLRLFGEEGFRKLSSASAAELAEVSGLQLVLFAADPNEQKETLDILVIGAELKRALSQALSGAWASDVREGRALAARWGVRKLPAAALFRSGTFLGACEGLRGWDEYLSELAQIAARTEAPKRTISILPSANPQESTCG